MTNTNTTFPQNWEQRILYSAVNPSLTPEKLKANRIKLVALGAVFTLLTFGFGGILVKHLHTTYVHYKDKITELDAKITKVSLLNPTFRTFENKLSTWAGNDQNRIHAKNAILESLTTNELSLDRIDEIPAFLGELTNLTKLVLSDIQKPVKIPESLKSLESLSIDNCNLTDINHLNSFQKLRVVSIDNNGKMMQLPALPPNLTELTLKKVGLTEVPQEILALSSLTRLNLTGNQLQTIPDGIQSLKDLAVLDLSENPLKKLPQAVISLPNLDKLFLKKTDLEEIPPEISSMKKLQILDLSNNQLSSLPNEMALLTEMTKIELTHNKFTTFPPVLADIPKLKSFNLNYNEGLDHSKFPEKAKEKSHKFD